MGNFVALSYETLTLAQQDKPYTPAFAPAKAADKAADKVSVDPLHG